ncbi:MAG: hypothetical protein CVV42_00075 [Candidatus Riflebacteria bacterium HGW-Riflebacteria-2]|jgi:hypothetical protein|nr:MAG: hypothetical protein CVV42_00075 [Candidatus Riflebacteria bacterium HGW-Riflebacteria-2]
MAILFFFCNIRFLHAGFMIAAPEGYHYRRQNLEGGGFENGYIAGIIKVAGGYFVPPGGHPLTAGQSGRLSESDRAVQPDKRLKLVVKPELRHGSQFFFARFTRTDSISEDFVSEYAGFRRTGRF